MEDISQVCCRRQQIATIILFWFQWCDSELHQFKNCFASGRSQCVEKVHAALEAAQMYGTVEHLMEQSERQPLISTAQVFVSFYCRISLKKKQTNLYVAKGRSNSTRKKVLMEQNSGSDQYQTVYFNKL